MTTQTPMNTQLPLKYLEIQQKTKKGFKNHHLIKLLLNTMEAMAEEIAIRRNELNPKGQPWFRNDIITDYFSDDEGFYIDDNAVT